ncbi:MAG: DUF1573 domain-containing protein [Prevotellaceae bacterium]|jgi:hypothetical protein|nr:DUF1573 domain-containing protein [Prevotellaceae bacterium]
MKRILTTLVVATAALLSAVAQPRIAAGKTELDLGKTAWKQAVTVSYALTNTGNEPLVISRVEPSCACTVTNWQEKTLAPGASDILRVTFDAQALGHFDKMVIVYSNGSDKPLYLYFRGEVTRDAPPAHVEEAEVLAPPPPIDPDAPAIALSATNVNLNTLPVMKNSRVRRDIRISNTGRSVLHLDEIEVFDMAVAIDLKRQQVKPGKHVRLRITVDTSKLKQPEGTLRIHVKSNDPRRPLAEILLHY